MISFDNVSFSYTKGHEVIHDISFELKEGEKTALLGLNGSGKSTLMLLCNGLLLPTKGRVLVDDIPTDSKSKGEIRKLVGLVFQNPDDQLFMPTVREDVEFGPRNMKLPKEEMEKRVEAAMKATGTEHLIDKSPFELSGGQKKAVSIATVLSMDPKYLIMDEPTSGMDFKAIENFIEVVSGLKQGCLISTHDMDVARALCSRAIVLENGRKVFDGNIGDCPY